MWIKLLWHIQEKSEPEPRSQVSSQTYNSRAIKFRIENQDETVRESILDDHWKGSAFPGRWLISYNDYYVLRYIEYSIEKCISL